MQLPKCGWPLREHSSGGQPTERLLQGDQPSSSAWDRKWMTSAPPNLSTGSGCHQRSQIGAGLGASGSKKKNSDHCRGESLAPTLFDHRFLGLLTPATRVRHRPEYLKMSGRGPVWLSACVTWFAVPGRCQQGRMQGAPGLRSRISEMASSLRTAHLD